MKARRREKLLPRRSLTKKTIKSLLASLYLRSLQRKKRSLNPPSERA